MMALRELATGSDSVTECSAARDGEQPRRALAVRWRRRTIRAKAGAGGDGAREISGRKWCGVYTVVRRGVVVRGSV
jgi:hypothetical protein